MIHSISIWLPTALALLALVVAGFALRVAVYGARLAQDAHDKAHEKVERTPTEASVLQLSGEVTEMRDAMASLAGQLKKLRSRITMRQNREKRGNGGDPDENTQALKARLRRDHLIGRK